MTSRRLLLAAALALALPLALAACPLPQPLPEVGHVDGGTVTPPRIVIDTVRPADTVVLVDRTCAGSFLLSASVDDANTTENVEARWFADYDARTHHTAMLVPPELIAPPADVTVTARAVSPLAYGLPPYDPAAPVHVVDLVVSNGFASDDTVPLPNRSAQPGFEVQVYRWVFRYVDQGLGICHYP